MFVNFYAWARKNLLASVNFLVANNSPVGSTLWTDVICT